MRRRELNPPTPRYLEEAAAEVWAKQDASIPALASRRGTDELGNPIVEVVERTPEEAQRRAELLMGEYESLNPQAQAVWREHGGDAARAFKPVPRIVDGKWTY